MTAGRSTRLLRLGVAVALTAYVLWQANPAAVWRAGASADWRWLLAAVALVLVDRTLMAYRWMVLLRALSPGTRPPFAAVLRIFFVSTFVGSFLPSLAGDMYRAYSLSRLRVSGVESAASVIMDRALGVVSMVLVAVVALAFARDLIALPGVLPTVVLAAAGCAAAASALYSERVASLALAATGRLPGRKARTLGAGLVDAVRKYTRHHGDVTNVLISSVGVQVIRVVQAYCLGVALGITAPLWTYFAFVPLIVIVMQIPVTVSGLGTSQVMFPLFFGAVGVPPAEAVALSLLFVALGVVGNLPGALLYAGGARHAHVGAREEPQARA
ncbi:MAG TPA: lysylphosphatidylglycerol synthase transmembrane domain-containing protein [Vicinamibacterales bacterium]|nr:lysylphosphatidylglycerol synthase transmembrane domain-containing protein [Vicinamibacterales bacterium]